MRCLLIILCATTACTAAHVGAWRGTVDLGPVAAPELEIHVDEAGTGGRVDVAEPGKPFSRFQLCAVQLDPQEARKITLEYDVNRPGCETQHADPSDRRRLVGTVGEGLWTGDVFKGSDRIGFFRALRLPPDDSGKLPPPPAPAAGN
jgi:hypothetical protein